MYPKTLTNGCQKEPDLPDLPERAGHNWYTFFLYSNLCRHAFYSRWRVSVKEVTHVT